MDQFSYKGGALHAEDVELAAIAEAVGTPTYVYSQTAMKAEYTEFQRAFAGLDHLVCYAMKANSNKAVLNTFAGLGAGADIVSGGELARALAAGIPAGRIVYSGVGKLDWELEAALRAGILMFNVESPQELVLLDQLAGRLGLRAPVSLRVNPDVDARTHPKITTGLAKNKFGLDMDLAFAQYLHAARLANLDLVGVSCHIGSQLTEVSPFADALERLAGLVLRLRQEGVNLGIIDLGGGVGIKYNEEKPPTIQEYAARMRPTLEKLGLRLVLEPGRRLVGSAGALLTRVHYTKTTPAKHFVVVDAAMNDLIRPAFYDSFHAIRPLDEGVAGGERIVADLVGGICETGDFLARDRGMPILRRGDLIALMSAGAYGFAMSSQYNSRPRAAEVLVSGDQWAVVRQRETIEDLSRGEELAPWMI